VVHSAINTTRDFSPLLVFNKSLFKRVWYAYAYYGALCDDAWYACALYACALYACAWYAYALYACAYAGSYDRQLLE
jgi:hypothetical protein